MTIHVRAARPEDIGPMHRIRLAVLENRLSDSTEIEERSYAPFVRSGGAWVADSGAGILGFAAIDAKRKSVWALFVDPEAEGTGVGKALHKRMLEWSHERGFRRISLTTGEGTRAERFYLQQGWTRVGRSDDGEVEFERVL